MPYQTTEGNAKRKGLSYTVDGPSWRTVDERWRTPVDGRLVWVCDDEDSGYDGVTTQPETKIILQQQVANSPEPIYIGDPPPETQTDMAQYPPTVEDSLPARLLSMESGYAPFETLFHDLQLTADSTYNFWEDGEDSNAPTRGVQILEELPRYVLLKWMQAPDVKDPRQFKKNRLQSQSPDARASFIKLSPFGFGARAVVGVTQHGVQWTPPNLQPDNFEQNVASIANGYLASGIIETVVTVLTGTVTPPQNPSSQLVDEDEFLAHSDMFEGITYSEFNAATWHWNSRVFGLQQSMHGTLSPAAESAKASFFRGQFTLSPMSVQGLDLRAVSSYGPVISMRATTADSITPPALPRPYQMASEMGMDYIRSTTSEAQSTHGVKVKMIHTNLEGLVSQRRVMATTSPEHAESIMAVSPFIGNLAIYNAAGYQDKQRDLTIPSFPAPADLRPFEYIGYVIEKYEHVNGSFKLVETINIPGREYDSYYDTSVKYGVPYRYRIKAVARWSRQTSKGVMGYDPSTYPSTVAGIDAISPNKVSFFAGEWANDWATAFVIDTTPPNAPDEFVVRAHSSEKVVEITMKLPYNPQQDISKMTIWRKVQDEWGSDLTNWVQIQEFDAELRQGTKLNVIAEYEHQQDDITGVKYSVRESQEVQTYVEFAPLNCRYIDMTVPYFGEGSRFRFVYAGLCHSRHGEISKLSDQLAARLNPHWKKDGEFPVNFVSCAGVDKDFDSGAFSVYPELHHRSEVMASAGTNIVLSGQTRMAKRALNSNSYVARVESLDTGEYVDMTVNVNVLNKPQEITEQMMPVIV